MEPAHLIAKAARKSSEALAEAGGISSVSRPPFQNFSSPQAAHWYFAKQVADFLTPVILELVSDQHSLVLWPTIAGIWKHLLSETFAAKFHSENLDYRAVQELAADTVKQLASVEALAELEKCLVGLSGDGLGSVSCVQCVSQATAKNRGRRNEDRLLVAAAASTKDHNGSPTDAASNATSFLAVLDGHGGSDSAELASAFLLPLWRPTAVDDAHEEVSTDSGLSPVARRMRSLFLRADAMVTDAAAKCGTSGGSTCTVCSISGNHLAVAWAGDSEAWLIRRPPAAPLQLTRPPHRPSEPAERARVEAAGGFVMEGRPPRLNGVLAVTRSLGDSSNLGAIAEPQVVEMTLRAGDVGGEQPAEDICVVLASDGLWDAVSGEAAAELLWSIVVEGGGKAKAASALIELAVAKGSTDNATVIVAWLI